MTKKPRTRSTDQTDSVEQKLKKEQLEKEVQQQNKKLSGPNRPST